MNVLLTALYVFVGSFIFVPLLLGLARFFGLYTIVDERTCHVYVLFGKVRAILSEPGLNTLWTRFGPIALLFRFLGTRYIVDYRLDQEYLRSQPVNSEEGAPMGIGIWYEMFVSDPIAFLFKNVDPRGSLRANVSNVTVRSLSNMKLAEMLENRHTMSRTVRNDVTPKSNEWGFKLGSVYIRKVHFRDAEMMKQIEEKVVNRLRQVTAAIKQDGANQVSLIRSTAERKAAIEFARATAMRPQIVGEALKSIARDRDVSNALFECIEYENLLSNESIEITLVPMGTAGPGLKQLVTAEPGQVKQRPPAAPPHISDQRRSS